MTSLRKYLFTTVLLLILVISLFTSGCSRYYSYQQLSQYTKLDFIDAGGGSVTDNMSIYDTFEAGLHRKPSRTFDMSDIKPLGLGKSSRIFIFTDNRSFFTKGFDIFPWLDYSKWYATDHRFKGDFSNFFMVVAFREKTEHPLDLIRISDIWQNENTVYIRALFYNADPNIFHVVLEDHSRFVKKYVIPGKEYLDYTAKAVDKNQMARFGRLTFKLLDDYGIERAATTAVIVPP